MEPVVLYKLFLKTYMSVEITNCVFTARKLSLRKGNIFTRVCHSVHRGGVLSPRGCT